MATKRAEQALTAREQVEALRAERDGILAKIDGLERLSIIPEADALANAEAMLKRIVQEAREVIQLHQLTHHGYAPTNMCGMDRLKPLSVAVFFAGKNVREIIARELAEFYLEHPGAVMPEAERAEQLAACRAALRTIEIQEEQVIEQSETAGLAIPRRTDCDPSVVLGVDPGAALPWDFRSEKLDRLSGESEAARVLQDIRSDAWMEARQIVARMQGILDDRQSNRESEASIREARTSLDIAKKDLERASTLRQQAMEEVSHKLAISSRLRDYVEKHRQARPAPFTREDIEAAEARQFDVSHGIPKSQQFAGGYRFGHPEFKG